jgi:serine palmitoyltransferase
MGFVVYGDEDSPIVPVLLYQCAKIPAFSHEMLARNMAVVVVGYPAVPRTKPRVRFCLSAALSMQDIEDVLKATDEIGDKLNMKIALRS